MSGRVSERMPSSSSSLPKRKSSKAKGQEFFDDRHGIGNLDYKMLDGRLDERKVAAPSPQSGSKTQRLQSSYHDKEDGLWKCRHCRYVYPEPNPDSRQRRDHKKYCSETLKVRLWLGAFMGQHDGVEESFHGEVQDPSKMESLLETAEHEATQPKDRQGGRVPVVGSLKAVVKEKDRAGLSAGGVQHGGNQLDPPGDTWFKIDEVEEEVYNKLGNETIAGRVDARGIDLTELLSLVEQDKADSHQPAGDVLSKKVEILERVEESQSSDKQHKTDNEETGDGALSVKVKQGTENIEHESYSMADEMHGKTDKDGSTETLKLDLKTGDGASGKSPQDQSSYFKSGAESTDERDERETVLESENTLIHEEETESQGTSLDAVQVDSEKQKMVKPRPSLDQRLATEKEDTGIDGMDHEEQYEPMKGHIPIPPRSRALRNEADVPTTQLSENLEDVERKEIKGVDYNEQNEPPDSGPIPTPPQLRTLHDEANVPTRELSENLDDGEDMEIKDADHSQQYEPAVSGAIPTTPETRKLSTDVDMPTTGLSESPGHGGDSARSSTNSTALLAQQRSSPLQQGTDHSKQYEPIVSSSLPTTPETRKLSTDVDMPTTGSSESPDHGRDSATSTPLLAEQRGSPLRLKNFNSESTRAAYSLFEGIDPTAFENMEPGSPSLVPEEKSESDDTPIPSPLPSHLDDPEFPFPIPGEKSDFGDTPNPSPPLSHVDSIEGGEITTAHTHDEEDASHAHIIDYDLERMFRLQKAFELFCPRCGAKITHKVVMRKKRRSFVPKELRGPKLSEITEESLTEEGLTEETLTSHRPKDKPGDETDGKTVVQRWLSYIPFLVRTQD